MNELDAHEKLAEEYLQKILQKYEYDWTISLNLTQNITTM